MTIDAVPSRPIRDWLIAWTLQTCDPPELTAVGFDLNPGLVADLLGPEPPRLLWLSDARELCAGLSADPAELWPPETAARLWPCDWPTEPLWAEINQAAAGLVRRRTLR